MKHIELFKDGFDNTINDKIQPENWPYIGYDEVNGEMVYTVVPEPIIYDPYVTFTAEEDNSSIGLTYLSPSQTLEYSIDTTNWNTFDTTTNIPLNNSDKVYVRGMLSADNKFDPEHNVHDYTKFKMTGKIAASGNCNAIWNYKDLNATLKSYCGYRMFDGCESLTTAPELPATTLAQSCYGYMFNGCESLTTAPELPAIGLARACYEGMFQNCTSLTTAPEVLPATTLADYCYYSMFYLCSSLTTAPVLPAATLAQSCYYSMFGGCAKLNHITCLATNIPNLMCVNYWVYGVAGTGTFVKHPNMNDWTTGNLGIPKGWTVIDAVI